MPYFYARIVSNMVKSSTFFLDIVKIVIIALIIIIPIRFFVVQPFFVRGASMEPTYSQGDYLLVDEISYRFSEPDRGDVIIFRAPTGESQFFIKRVIGLPGETVRVAGGEVLIINDAFTDGFVLGEEYIGNSITGNLETTLNENEYFMLGDNRGASFDSRAWGPLEHDLIIGKVFLRAWPFGDFGLIDTPQYETGR